MATICCVCDGEIAAGGEKFANAWERTRGRLACCSDTCASTFNPDLHWLPSYRPQAAAEPESVRLIAVLRMRLADGDSPQVLTRELLLAGVAPARIRGTLMESHAAGDRSRREALETSALGLLKGLFTGTFSVGINRDKRDPARFAAAYGDVDRWEAAMDRR